MRKIMIALTSVALMGSVSLVGSAAPAQAGCLTGAIVGGIAGHFAHHGVAGAAAGCAAGHYAGRYRRTHGGYFHRRVY